MVTRAAWAKEEEGYLPVHVCVRPPYLKMSVVVWTYYANTTDFIYVLPADYATRRYKYPTYLYDPEAPPENTQQLPREEDRKLPCDPKPPPPAPPPKEPPKEEAPKPGGSGAGGSGGQEPPLDRKKEAPRAPPAPQDEAPARAPEGEPRDHPRWPEGVTKDWPRSVLPTREAEPKRSVLPTKRRDDPCAWRLPWAGQKKVDRAQACRGHGNGNGNGNGDGDGGKGSEEELRTWLGKATPDMAVLAAVVNMQFDEDLERKDGKRYGIVGGKNLDGPDSALVQAFASITMIAAVVLSPKAEAFEKKLKDALAKGKRLLMKDMEKVGEGVAEELAKKEAAKVEQKILQETGKPLKASAKRQAELDARKALAHTMTENGGAIGPYKVMTQFTEKLEGDWQAHHILEKRWAEEFKFGNPDKFPSVILTEAEHKKFTAKLMAEARKVKKMELMDLWKIYQKVYEEHPAWLKAIRPYFFKGK